MKKLVNTETIQAYSDRFKKMIDVKFSPEGDDLFIEKVVATSSQIDNLRVQAHVNDFVIECDEPRELGGTNSAPRPIDLLLASLANCLEISALLYFSFSNLKIDSVKVTVKTEIDKRALLNDKNAPLPGFHHFNIIWDIDTIENEKKVKKIIDKIEKFCPISGTLSRAQRLQWIINLSS
ncbi:MAG: OsmC family protein [Promethearchaeota archaeon]